ncbi:MAG: protein kinase [Acidobacteriota bacterium]
MLKRSLHAGRPSLVVVSRDAGTPDFDDALEASGFAAATFATTSGQEALQTVNANEVRAVVADLLLTRPGLSGAEMLKRLGPHHQGCRTILLSDHGALSPLLRGIADVVLVRPVGSSIFDTPELVPTLSKWLVSSTSSGEAETKPHVPVGMPRHLIGGKYRVVGSLGHGGMSTVYRAIDTFIKRSVAVKVVQLSERQKTDQVLQRAHREVRISGHLAHPNIVTVYDAGFDDEGIYLVMEIVEGCSLRDRLHVHETLGVDVAIEITNQILDALAHAHARGVVHRDLKPGNVMLDSRGRVKVVDFGVAKLVRETVGGNPMGDLDKVTLDGTVIGTFGYMPPEQLAGKSVDARSDLYALGIVLLEMLYGRGVVKRGSPLASLTQLAMGRPFELPPMPGRPRLEAVMRRVLAARPDDRFDDTESFRAALLDAVANESTDVCEPSVLARRGM